MNSKATRALGPAGLREAGTDKTVCVNVSFCNHKATEWVNIATNNNAFRLPVHESLTEPGLYEAEEIRRKAEHHSEPNRSIKMMAANSWLER